MLLSCLHVFGEGIPSVSVLLREAEEIYANEKNFIGAPERKSLPKSGMLKLIEKEITLKSAWTLVQRNDIAVEIAAVRARYGKTNEAFEILEPFRHHGADFTWGVHNIVLQQAERKEYSKAIRTLESRLNGFGYTTAMLRLRVAITMLQNGDLEESLEYYRELDSPRFISSGGNDDHIRTNIARYYPALLDCLRKTDRNIEIFLNQLKSELPRYNTTISKMLAKEAKRMYEEKDEKLSRILMLRAIDGIFLENEHFDFGVWNEIIDIALEIGLKDYASGIVRNVSNKLMSEPAFRDGKDAAGFILEILSKTKQNKLLDKAIEDIKRFPGHINAHKAIFLAYLRTERYQEARAYLDTVPKDYVPISGWNLYDTCVQQGLKLLFRNEKHEEIPFYIEKIRRLTNKVFYFNALAARLYDNQNKDKYFETKKLLELELETIPKKQHSALHATLADEEITLGKFELAEERLGKIEDEEQRETMFLCLVLGEHLSGKTETAKRRFLDHYENSPQKPEKFFETLLNEIPEDILNCIHSRETQVDGTRRPNLKSYIEAIKKEPTEQENHFLRMKISTRIIKGEFAEAYELSKKLPHKWDRARALCEIAKNLPV